MPNSRKRFPLVTSILAIVAAAVWVVIFSGLDPSRAQTVAGIQQSKGGSTVTPGGSNLQIQYNNSGAFGGRAPTGNGTFVAMSSSSPADGCGLWTSGNLGSTGVGCGGTGSPGGTNGQIQYNNSGAFGGRAPTGSGTFVAMAGSVPADGCAQWTSGNIATTASPCGAGTGGGITLGTYADFLLAPLGAAGATYKLTDGPYTFVSTGTKWQPFVYGTAVTLPPSSLTWINQGTSTVSYDAGTAALLTQTASGSTYSMRVLGTALPSLEEGIRLTIAWNVVSPIGNANTLMGLIAYRSSGDGFHLSSLNPKPGGSGYGGTTAFTIAEGDNFTSPFNVGFFNDAGLTFGGPLVWERLTYTTATAVWKYEYSLDGNSWYLIVDNITGHSILPSDGIDSWGFWATSSNGPALATFMDFKQEQLIAGVWTEL